MFYILPVSYPLTLAETMIKVEETGRVKKRQRVRSYTYRLLVDLFGWAGLGLVAALTESEALLINNPDKWKKIYM